MATRNIKIGFAAAAADVYIVYHPAERIFALKSCVSRHKLQALDVYCQCAVVIEQVMASVECVL